MPYAPFSPRLSTVYTLDTAYGTAVLNDDTHANFAGVTTEVTGLDSPDVRESAEDKPQAHGGHHGNFYQGRRPMTLTVRVFNHTSAVQRDARIDRLRRATKAYQPGDGNSNFNSGAPSLTSGAITHTSLYINDGILSWTYDGTPMLVAFRRQQPFRVSGPWVKEIMVPLVSPYNEIFSQAVNSVVGNNNCENIGDEAAYPVFRVTGPTSGTSIITHQQTNLKVQMLPTFGLTAGQYADIDTRTHTVRRNDGTDLTGYIDFANSTWPLIRPVALTNTFALAGGGALTTFWRHAWA